jgi:lambda family phage portal protein
MSLISFIRDIWNTPPRHSIEHSVVKKVRRYDGVKRGRLYGDWLATNSSANSEIWSSLSTLRNRSRDLCRNNDYARGVIQKLVDNVIYLGIGFQAQVKHDDRANNLIETAWKKWAEEPMYCHTAGKLNFPEIQQVAFRSWLESGEVFVRKVKRSFSNSPVPFALEIIEADQCPEHHNGTHNGNQIIMGVEIDSWKRPVAYWFYADHPGELWNLKGRKLERIPAEEIIHLHTSDRPNQLRGVPLLHSTILRLKNTGDYEEYEQIAAKAAASIMGLITTPDADLLGEPTQDNDNSLPADEQMQAGILRYLAPGEHLEVLDPKRPNPNVTQFIECQLRASGTGIGASYEQISGDYSKTNYSSSRLSLLNSRDRFKVLQVAMASKFIRLVYLTWLDMAVVGGVLNFADYELRPERYQSVKWQFRGWAWVDPYKEVQATLAALAGGLTTLTKVAAEQGEDFEEMVKTIAREREILKQHGVELVNQGNSEEEDSKSVIS